MPSSQTLYTITLLNGNTTAAPNDGFVDNLKIENYYTSLNTTPGGLTLELCQAKVRGNLRYRDIINQLSLISNCYVLEQVGSTQPQTTSDATGTTEATRFSFKIIVEHGDASLVTADEYNPGSYLIGAACVQRCVARALLNDMFRIVDVFDPTDSNSVGTFGLTTSIIRYGNRIMTDAATNAVPTEPPTFEIGPYASDVANANSLIDVAPMTTFAPVTIVNTQVAVLSNVSPATVNMNFFGANFVVVAVGWSSASTFEPPTVSINGVAMTLYTAKHELDTASGAVAIYTLPISNAPNATLPVVFTQVVSDGAMQAAIYAYANASDALGVVVADEYGTNSVPVATGTTSIGTVSATSLTAFAGFTFFSGTPTAINSNAGWTNAGQATGTNEGVFAFYSRNAGNLSITLSSAPVTNFNMLCMGWEVTA